MGWVVLDTNLTRIKYELAVVIWAWAVLEMKVKLFTRCFDLDNTKIEYVSPDAIFVGRDVLCIL
jgi:hypothetical protein